MTDTTILNYDTVEFDGVPYPVAGPVMYQNLAKFENRIVTGDPSKDDDELASTKVWSDFSGGLGILNEKEGADVGRYWFGVGLESSRPDQLALAPEVFSRVGQSACLPLGDVAGKMWMADGFKLLSFDPAANAWVTVAGNLNGYPANKPVVYNSKMYIPTTDGYDVWDGSTVTPGIAGNRCIDFCLWDTKLVALQIATNPGRKLGFYDGTSWTYPAGANLAGTGEQALHVRSFYTRSDEPAIYIITSQGIWGYDNVGQQMIQTNVQFPRNSANALGAVVWKSGENLNVSAGMGVYAWSGPGGSIAPKGLDRDEGMPIEYTGKIIDLEPSQNEMYALVKAPDAAGNFHGLYAYNEIGWRCVHTVSALNTNAFWIKVSSLNDQMRVFWTCGYTIYWQQIPFGYANAREIVKGGGLTYQPSGYITTSWFDANMQEFSKLLSHFYTRQATEPLTASSGLARPTVKVEYQINTTAQPWLSTSASWSALFQGDLNFGTIRIRFRLTLTRGTLATGAQASPVMDALVLKYIKVPSLYGSWSFTVPLNFEGFWGPPGSNGVPRDAMTIKHDLDALLAMSRFLTFGHEGNTYRSRISRVSGADEKAMDRRGSRTLTVVQVPFSGNTVQAQ